MEDFITVPLNSRENSSGELQCSGDGAENIEPILPSVVLPSETRGLTENGTTNNILCLLSNEIDY